MWKNISKIILNNRVLIVFLILVLTIFFGFFATKIKLQYQINKLLPENDSTYIAYQNFKSNFGQDGLMLVIATTEPNFYSEKKFNAWLEMADSIGNVSRL